MLFIEKIILLIRFRARARHRHGRGVHPPFAYGFISQAVFGEDIQGLEKIESLRRDLLGSRKVLHISDQGAGSGHLSGGRRSTGKLVRYTAVSRKKGQLLARIVSCLDPGLIIELGTGAGISSLYMAASCPSTRVLSCEGSSSVAALARSNIKRMAVSNIEVFNQNFTEWLPGVLNQTPSGLSIFIDGDHRGRRLLRYFKMITGSGCSKTVVIMDDIHWSIDMYRAWRTIIKGMEVSLSLELFNTGVVFIGYNIQKNHYIINF